MAEGFKVGDIVQRISDGQEMEVEEISRGSDDHDVWRELFYAERPAVRAVCSWVERGKKQTRKFRPDEIVLVLCKESEKDARHRLPGVDRAPPAAGQEN